MCRDDITPIILYGESAPLGGDEKSPRPNGLKKKKPKHHYRIIVIYNSSNK